MLTTGARKPPDVNTQVSQALISTLISFQASALVILKIPIWLVASPASLHFMMARVITPWFVAVAKSKSGLNLSPTLTSRVADVYRVTKRYLFYYVLIPVL